MPWEMKETPKVGDRFAGWIWVAVVVVAIIGLIGIAMWTHHNAAPSKQQPTGGAPTSELRIRLFQSFHFTETFGLRLSMPRGISITDQDIVPIENVAPGVSGLRIIMVNVYAISTGSEWVLVDAGLYLSAGRIRRWAENQFGNHKPAGIFLTHGHFDHVGSLKDLADQWNVPSMLTNWNYLICRARSRIQNRVPALAAVLCR